jgi:C3HC zinc finger-like/Rsm1-like
MSYAIETKKRKFERILESLTDGTASQSRTSLNSRNNGSTVSLATQTPSEASKRRRVAPTSLVAASKVPSKAASTTSLTEHYLPSSRQAFLERLETFRQVTKWHVPSTEPINASAWVKRGWICIDADTVFCGSCKERLFIDLEAKTKETSSPEAAENHDEFEDYSMEKEVHESLVKRYQDMITTAHSESCPWRKRGCDASIQRIEGLLNTNNVVSALKSRYESICKVSEAIPTVSPLPSEQATEHELDKFAFEGNEKPLRNSLRLAVCGWQQKADDVIECRNCFRSLGLWLYRGDDAAMDKLDAVESHLEYCPWRSPDAQDTEITVSMHEEDEIVQRKGKVSGSILVCQAMAKDNTKKRGPAADDRGLSSAGGISMANSVPLTPEQRDKKRLDLLRRIKDLKKPFKMKSLLRRKNKP